jgi:hypothetical protein
MENNVNTLNTDLDLTLKTGLGLRPKNNQAELSTKNWPSYGDVSAASLEVTEQNFGQFHKNLPVDMKVIDKNIPGLNHSPSPFAEGRMNDASRNFIDTYVVNKNYMNGQNVSCQQYKKDLLNSTK